MIKYLLYILKLLDVPIRLARSLFLFILFYGLITPLGYTLRILKKDILGLKLNKEKTYWIKKTQKKTSMKEQY